MSSEEHLCYQCKKNTSTVKLLIRSRGHFQTLYLCKHCYKKYNSHLDKTNNGYLLDIFHDLLTSKHRSLKNSPSEFERMSCSHCHSAFKKIIKEGEFGCLKCIYHFENLLDKYLSVFQKESFHRGLTPSNQEETYRNYQKLYFIKALLKESVQSEKILHARKIKNQVEILEKKLNDAFRKGI